MDSQRRQLRGWIGVDDRSADRAPIANLKMTDQRYYRSEQRVVCLYLAGSLHGALASESAQDKPAGRSLRDRRQSRHAVDVNNHLRASQAHIHQRHEALAPSQDFGVITVLGQQCQCFGQVRWRIVVERCWFHTPVVSLLVQQRCRLEEA